MIKNYLQTKHVECRYRLIDNTHAEAQVLREAINELSLQYPYILAYEYEVPGKSKGDAMLCCVRTGNRLDVLVLEAKHINYSDQVNRDNQKNKKRDLRHQVKRYYDAAESYISMYCPELDNFVLNVSAKGCFNNFYGKVEFMDYRDDLVEEDEPRLDVAQPPRQQIVTQEEEGFSWGKALAVGAVLGAAYIGSRSVSNNLQESRYTQQQNNNSNRNTQNTQQNNENNENCTIM